MEERSGKLIKGVGGLYTVRFADGETVSCKAKGAFRHESLKPVIGDDVTVISDGGNVISAIGERTASRPRSGRELPSRPIPPPSRSLCF